MNIQDRETLKKLVNALYLEQGRHSQAASDVNTAEDIILNCLAETPPTTHIVQDPKLVQLLSVVECLIDTAKRTTDLESVYDDKGQQDFTWAEVWESYQLLKDIAGVE